MTKLMTRRSSRQIILAAGAAIGLCLSSALQPALAAKDVAFVSGAFKRSISLSDIVYLADTGKARGFLSDVLRFAKQAKDQLQTRIGERKQKET
jgi:hypothetical protein